MFYRKLRGFLNDEEAQDLIEYTLLLGFVALVVAGLMIQAGNGVQGIWSTGNSAIATANSTASAGHHSDGDGDGGH